jgi:hypothetical protein
MCFKGFENIIKTQLTKVHTKIGEVIFINQATIHYSKPNYSEKIRPAITLGFISENAEKIFYYYENNKLEKFKTDEDFLLKFEDFHKSIFQRPKHAQPISNQQYNPLVLNEKEVANRLQSKKVNWWQKIFNS